MVWSNLDFSCSFILIWGWERLRESGINGTPSPSLFPPYQPNDFPQFYIDGDDEDEDEDVEDGNDDEYIYIMMKCVCVCHKKLALPPWIHL